MPQPSSPNRGYTSKQARSQIKICVCKLEGVWVFTWFNFLHHSIFKLDCPELESISQWVVEVRELWEPGE